MRAVTIGKLRRDTSMVLAWVAAGETVEVRRGDKPVAMLSPPAWKKRRAMPDFEARLRAIFGAELLPTTAAEVIAESRGES